MRAFTLWRLRQERKRAGKKFAKAINEAKDRDEVQALMSEAGDYREDIRDQILHLRSLELTDKAEDLGLPVPSYQDARNSWEDGREPGTVHLAHQALIQLQQAIRTERREKWNFAAFWLKEILTPFIGIIGAVMGLITVIHAVHSK